MKNLIPIRNLRNTASYVIVEGNSDFTMVTNNFSQAKTLYTRSKSKNLNFTAWHPDESRNPKMFALISLPRESNFQGESRRGVGKT